MGFRNRSNRFFTERCLAVAAAITWGPASGARAHPCRLWSSRGSLPRARPVGASPSPPPRARETPGHAQPRGFAGQARCRAPPCTLTPAYHKRRSHELAEYLRAKGVTVTLHNNESLGIDRNEAYSDSQVLLASARRGAQRASPQQ